MFSYKQLLLIFVFIAAFVGVFTLYYYKYKKSSADESLLYPKKGLPMSLDLASIQDVLAFFPKTATDIQVRTAQAMHEAKRAINDLISIKTEDRTFANTAKALDTIEALSEFAILFHAISILEMVSPDEAIRTAAHEATIKMQEFSIDELGTNRDLYKALKEYKENAFNGEQLTEKQQYYLTESLEAFERHGLNLPLEKQEKIRTLKKELEALSLTFNTNIATDNRTITVSKENLAGLDEHFITNLEQNEQGDYLLGVDYPTYFKVMENCIVEPTRKKMYIAFEDRAYPANDALLKTVIEKRDELARELGFASYAALDLDDQMVKNPEQAHQFLQNLLASVDKKVAQEVQNLSKELPESVTLTEDGKLKPWDIAFVKNQYKKKHLAIDEQKIAEYFPLEKTVEGLLAIYEKFFSIRFKRVPVVGAWHEEVTGIEVYDAKTNELLGYFLLDLYPRPNKYSHACNATVIPATYDANGKPNKVASIVIANFPRPTADRPALLERKYVTTFFHEFGHALHALLGRTQIASLAGTSVKRDFVEMPSQMLEEWLSDKEILKMVSNHYQTGEPLPDDLIEKILKLKYFDSGIFVQTQAYYALLALALFGPGAQKDPADVMKQLYEKIRTYFLFVPEDHMYASFGHLMGYGAKYYGYLWSKVFALDLFEQIRKEGLLNPVVGQRYVEQVIGQGGSVDPNQLLENFLGRTPNQKAFLRDLGLN